VGFRGSLYPGLFCDRFLGGGGGWREKFHGSAQVFTVSREKYLLDRNFMTDNTCSYMSMPSNDDSVFFAEILMALKFVGMLQ
jgi:hypothetical protein